MLLISRPSDACSEPRMSSMARLEQVLKGIKSLQARTRGRSLPRSAAQNERGVAEKRYHLGQHDAMGSGNPVLLRVLQVQGDHRGSSDIQGCVRKEDRHQQPPTPHLPFSREKGIMCGSWRVSMVTQSK